mgnify:CR=1 FL=1
MLSLSHPQLGGGDSGGDGGGDGGIDGGGGGGGALGGAGGLGHSTVTPTRDID